MGYFCQTGNFESNLPCGHSKVHSKCILGTESQVNIHEEQVPFELTCPVVSHFGKFILHLLTWSQL